VSHDPGAPEPIDPGTPIWRYMGIDRFLSLLHTRSLWFTRVDCFADAWEGHINHSALGSMFGRRNIDIPADGLVKSVDPLRVLPFVNCWTMLQYESVGLWRTFVGSSHGVVIRSTAGLLEDEVQRSRSEEGGHVAKVRYIDYAITQAVDAFNKRREYQYESEVRAAFYDFDLFVEVIRGRDRAQLPKGHDVPVILTDLITEVRVSPEAPVWFLGAIADLVAKYGLDVPVRPSALDDLPPGCDPPD